MKTLISILTLAAIVFVYVLSASLYLQGQLLGAYALVLSAICSIVFWIHNVAQPQKQRA
jgi:cbb3-type cytochrome oxidase subunit 1